MTADTTSERWIVRSPRSPVLDRTGRDARHSEAIASAGKPENTPQKSAGKTRNRCAVAGNDSFAMRARDVVG